MASLVAITLENLILEVFPSVVIQDLLDVGPLLPVSTGAYRGSPLHREQLLAVPRLAYDLAVRLVNSYMQIGESEKKCGD